MQYYTNIFWENIIKMSLYIFPFIEPYIIYGYKYIESWYVKPPIIIEPTTSEWINICSLVIIGQKYQLVNTNIIQNNHSAENDVKKEYYSFYKSFYSNYDYSRDDTNDNESVTKEHLFIAKLKNNKYICKVCFPKHVKYMFDYLEESETDEKKDTMEESETSLVYVEYSHPKMTTQISVPFSNNMLQPYNELFTPAFILRQLQTQMEYYYFDMDYELIILDSNLNRICLNSKQYILWQPNPDNYTIIQR
jgi:hypothetical protein